MCINAVKRERAIGKVEEGRGKLTSAPLTPLRAFMGRFFVGPRGKGVGMRRGREARLA